MAYKLPSLVVFLLLLAFQETMILRGDAVMCEADSKLFRGACFRPENCGSVCEKEGFLTGRCKLWKCVCIKQCTGGSPVQPPPSDNQPGEGPPGEDQPGEGPLNEGQPGEGPPSDEQPAEPQE